MRPFKQTAWGESVIEFILHMLWDLGLKVGHATRSLGECVRLAKQDITIRTALLEARFLWGDKTLYDELRKKFWAEVAAGTGQDFVEGETRRARSSAICGRAKAAISSSPTSRKARAGLRDLQTLYWIGKYLYHVDDTADLVEHNVFSRDEYKTFQKAEAFLWDVRCQLHYLGRPRRGAAVASTSSPRLASRMGFIDENPRRAVEHFMRAYFLVAKDVGDLTRIFCAALEEQNRKDRRASLAGILPGLSRSRAAAATISSSRTAGSMRGPTRSSAIPVNLIRIFHVAEAKRRRRPSRRAAHDHALARPHHRRRARRSQSQQAVPGDPDLAARSRTRAAP